MPKKVLCFVKCWAKWFTYYSNALVFGNHMKERKNKNKMFAYPLPLKTNTISILYWVMSYDTR